MNEVTEHLYTTREYRYTILSDTTNKLLKLQI